MVERQLPKLNVAGSNPVSRSIFGRRSQVVKAAVCKIAITSSILVVASIEFTLKSPSSGGFLLYQFGAKGVLHLQQQFQTLEIPPEPGHSPSAAWYNAGEHAAQILASYSEKSREAFPYSQRLIYGKEGGHWK